MSFIFFISFVTTVITASNNNTVFVIAASITVLSIVCLVLSGLIYSKMESSQKSHEKKQARKRVTTNPLDLNQRQEGWATSTPQRQPNQPSKKKVIPLESFAFTTDSDDYLCMVCKLPIRIIQKVVQCPFCQSYFHKDHLYDWLKMADDCPVCNSHLKTRE